MDILTLAAIACASGRRMAIDAKLSGLSRDEVLRRLFAGEPLRDHTGAKPAEGLRARRVAR